MFENKVLRNIFGAKRDEIIGERRKLHNAELCTEQSRNAYRVLVGKPEGRRSLGKPRRRWEDNIKMDLREVGCDPRG